MTSKEPNDTNDSADWAEDFAFYTAENKGRIKKTKLQVKEGVSTLPLKKTNDTGEATGWFSYDVLDRKGSKILTIESARDIKTFFSKK